MGKHGVGEMNENGEMFAETCANNSLVIGGVFKVYSPIKQSTKQPGCHQTMSQKTKLTISVGPMDIF